MISTQDFLVFVLIAFMVSVIAGVFLVGFAAYHARAMHQQSPYAKGEIARHRTDDEPPQ